MDDPSESPAYLDGVKSFIEENIPFNRFLGFRALELRRGFASLLMPFREEFVGDPFRPALHGGTLSALADTAGGAAVFTATEMGSRVSTIDLRIDYLRPGRPADVVAEATLIRLGNRVGVTRIMLSQAATEGGDQERATIAEVTGVYSIRVPEAGR